MTLRQALLNSIGESCAVASNKATQQRNFSIDPVLSALMLAAMGRCDQFNDGEQARQEMREQVMEIPTHLRQDLLEHLLGRPAPCSLGVLYEPLNPAKGP